MTGLPATSGAVLVQHTGGEARTVMLNPNMKQEKLDGLAALGMHAKRYNEDTVQNLARVDTGAESSDNQGRETGSSDGRGVGSCEVEAQCRISEEPIEVLQVAIFDQDVCLVICKTKSCRMLNVVSSPQFLARYQMNSSFGMRQQTVHKCMARMANNLPPVAYTGPSTVLVHFNRTP